MPKPGIIGYFNFKGIVATVVGLTLIVGSVLGVHAYFAKDKEFREYVKVIDIRLAEVNNNLLMYQTEQSKSYVQEKIWKVQDRVEQKPSDTDAKQQLRELENEKQQLDIRLQDLKKGK